MIREIEWILCWSIYFICWFHILKTKGKKISRHFFYKFFPPFFLLHQKNFQTILYKNISPEKLEQIRLKIFFSSILHWKKCFWWRKKFQTNSHIKKCFHVVNFLWQIHLKKTFFLVNFFLTPQLAPSPAPTPSPPFLSSQVSATTHSSFALFAKTWLIISMTTTFLYF